ncbi:FxLD family lantipeptide [Spongiactinospora rosea]|uniref:FxLD family lantipeptide n=1 Tax=Spongiactinospora rosea TaxID=2248750 RepID=A0A366LTH2_9ACTN|nr:FxLD family lanthipeptide [Spongiactinospora rosea]RBQ17221.1 FxLD family lantipeptide [Spongiactinospora rosea]
MSIRLAETPPASPAPGPGSEVEPDAGPGLEPDFELDITFVESGPQADRLIRMTDDGCGKTCQSACSSTCP